MKNKNYRLISFLLICSFGLKAGIIFDDSKKDVETSFSLAGYMLGIATACGSSQQEDIILSALRGYAKDEKVTERFGEPSLNYFVSVLKEQSDLSEASTLRSRKKVYRLTCEKLNSATLPHFKACIGGQNIGSCVVPSLLDFF